MLNDVQIVKLPIAWSMSHEDALFLQMGSKEEIKAKQDKIVSKRTKEEDEARQELAHLLDDGYRLLSSLILTITDRTFIIYTLYHS